MLLNQLNTIKHGSVGMWMWHTARGGDQDSWAASSARQWTWTQVKAWQRLSLNPTQSWTAKGGLLCVRAANMILLSATASTTLQTVKSHHWPRCSELSQLFVWPHLQSPDRKPLSQQGGASWLPVDLLRADWLTLFPVADQSCFRPRLVTPTLFPLTWGEKGEEKYKCGK